MGSLGSCFSHLHDKDFYFHDGFAFICVKANPHFLTYQQDTPKLKPFGGDWKLLNLYCVQVGTHCCAVKPHSSSQLV